MFSDTAPKLLDSDNNLLFKIAQILNSGGGSGGGGGGGGTLSTDGTFAANSDALYPSQKATRTYVTVGLATKQNSLGYTPVNKAGDAGLGSMVWGGGEASISSDGSASFSSGTVVFNLDGSGFFGGGNLTFSDLGVLTAASFVGPLTGAASLNVLKAGDTMTGALGIGVAPLARLHVRPAASGTDYFRVDHSDGTKRMQVGAVGVFGSIWLGDIVPTGTNYAILSDGNSTYINAGAANLFLGTGSNIQWNINSGGHFLATIDNTYDIGASGVTRPRHLYLAGNMAIGGHLAIGDTILERDAANILALRNSTNAQTFRLYNTYTDASNYERGFMRWNTNVMEIGVEVAGTGTSRALQFLTANTARWNITTAGNLNAVGTSVAFTANNITQSVASLLSITSGTNQRAGDATLVAGTVTVSNTTITANTRVMMNRKTAGGTLGQGLVYSVSAGTSFTITSVDATGVLSAFDTSVVSFFLVEVV